MTERAKDIRAVIIGCIIGIIAYVLHVAGALGHSWYDPECCSDQDCYAVPAEDVIEIENGWKHLPTGTVFPKDKVKPSKDHRFHVCIGNKAWDRGKPYCIYILQGV